jgi:spore maturation protein CgeB
VISDWNHGNAHFLRGIADELIARGHSVILYEPCDGWSLRNLVANEGLDPVEHFHHAYPRLSSRLYDLPTFDIDRELDRVDLVLVHEWNDPALVRRLGEHRSRTHSYRLLFHDTHHRAISKWAQRFGFDLRDYDGVLAFGSALRDLYISHGWAEQVWTWHEAADTRVFVPQTSEHTGDIVWIGNWGDNERNAVLSEFLIDPIHDLGVRASAYGVRYPRVALERMRHAGIRYRGWIPNFEVPRVFAQYKATVHVPRAFYVRELPGIPTIRVFEALACGIPLLCAPWEDAEHLFQAGTDFLVASDREDMKRKLRLVLTDECVARELSSRGIRTILNRHTCVHRVDELLAIYSNLRSLPETSAKLQTHEVERA